MRRFFYCYEITIEKLFKPKRCHCLETFKSECKAVQCMYTRLKSIVKKIIPQGFLFKNELIFKKVLIPFYMGKTYSCNICKHNWNKFIEIEDNDLLCPYCGSRSRTRRLFKLLKKQSALNGEILHFSPSRSLYRIFKQDENFKYCSSDFENEFLAEYKLDITQIDMPDNSFDTIICYQILEHIIDDQKAIAELKRILKPNGQCFIQTPFKSGEIIEDFRLTSPSERLEAFGQEDHVRIYSLDGLIGRLKEQGLKTKCLKFDEELIPHGLLQENIIIVTK